MSNINEIKQVMQQIYDDSQKEKSSIQIDKDDLFLQVYEVLAKTSPKPYIENDVIKLLCEPNNLKQIIDIVLKTSSTIDLIEQVQQKLREVSTKYPRHISEYQRQLKKLVEFIKLYNENIKNKEVVNKYESAERFEKNGKIKVEKFVEDHIQKTNASFTVTEKADFIQNLEKAEQVIEGKIASSDDVTISSNILIPAYPQGKWGYGNQVENQKFAEKRDKLIEELVKWGTDVRKRMDISENNLNKNEDNEQINIKV